MAIKLHVDGCQFYEHGFDYARLNAVEQFLFNTTRLYTAIDVYASVKASPELVNAAKGLRVRIYASTGGGAEIKVYDKLFRHALPVSGIVAKARGAASRYRVSFTFDDPFTPGLTPSFNLSYVAHGDQPTPAEGPSDPVLPPCAPSWSANGEIGMLGSTPFVLIPNATPIILRQVFGSCILAVPTWIQLWQTNVAGDAIASLRSQVYVSAVGQTFLFDFRDPHRLAHENDGYLIPTYAALALSSTPDGYTASAGSRISYNYECRFNPL